MPYQVVFAKTLSVSRADDYLDWCCWGGDLIARRLLPLVEARYRDIRCDQEDWGWFIWFREGPIDLAIDIFCDDPAAGHFRVRLTSKMRRWVSSRIVDRPELETLRHEVLARLASWPVSGLATARLDGEFRELAGC